MGGVDPRDPLGTRVSSIDLPLHSRRSGQAALEHRIKEIWRVRIRDGRRRVHVLRPEGWRHGQKRTRRCARVYCELGLQRKVRDDRKPAIRTK